MLEEIFIGIILASAFGFLFLSVDAYDSDDDGDETTY